MNKSELIHAYTEAGYTLFPLNGKIPALAGWRNIPFKKYGEKELEGRNYGVVLNSDDLVIDVDPRNFNPKDDKPLSRLNEAVNGELNPLFVVQTGRGGLHLYYKKPPEIRLAAHLKDYPGIDFKREGGYVVAAGSVHPDTGKIYEIKLGLPKDVVLISPKLLKVLELAPVLWEGRGIGGHKDDEQSKSRYIEYLRTCASPSVEGNNGDANAFKVAVYARDLGLSPETAFDILFKHWNEKCIPPWNEEELQAKVVNAYKYGKKELGVAHPAAVFSKVEAVAQDRGKSLPGAWDVNSRGIQRKSFFNLLNYFRFPGNGLYKVFGYNDFTCRSEFINPAPWHLNVLPKHKGIDDLDLKLIKAFLTKEYKFEKSISEIEEAVSITAHENRFHPVREYLESLIWDKTPRIDTWLQNYMGVVDTPYTRACARKTLCAAVMRVMRPGVKFDHVLVFEGSQGIGKSTVCRILGGEWAADFTLDPHSPDSIQMMQGKWIIELAEMEPTRKADVSALKAFISRDKDEARLAYGRLSREFYRQSIFIGSINPNADGTYLQDDENRRWWPVRCEPKGGQVDFKAFREVRNQLFAEAVWKVKQEPGEKLYMDTKELNKEAKFVVKQRHAEHHWTERIARWIDECDGKIDTRREFLTSRDVFIEAIGGTDRALTRQYTLWIAEVMRTLGWVAGVKRINGRLVRGYFRSPAVVANSFGKRKDLEILGDIA